MPKYLKISLILSIISLVLVSVILTLFLTLNNLKKSLAAYLQKSSAGETITRDEVTQLLGRITHVNQVVQLLAPFLPTTINSLSADGQLLAQEILGKQQKYVVVLQNSDELRATGGFMGSYFILESDAGQVRPIKIQDIYVPDGQYAGEVIPAPAGVAEYLSEGKGLRLSNANWWFDVAKSGEQISYFFETTIEQNLDGVIFINLNLVEKLLDLTGEIYLPDYQQIITSSNFASLARSDRDHFFPGSQEKANFLNHFLTMLKPKLLEIITKDPQVFLAWLIEQAKQKNIQIYSRDEKISTLLARRQLTTTPTQMQHGLNYFLVESNVGINKANRLVNREVTIDLDEHQERLSITWDNQNPFAYVNYQRIYLSPESKILELAVNGQRVDLATISQNTLVDSTNQIWQELSLLISILDQSQQTLELTVDSQLPPEDKKNLAIFKQAGLAPTRYRITHIPTQASREFELRSDQLISFD